MAGGEKVQYSTSSAAPVLPGMLQTYQYTLSTSATLLVQTACFPGSSTTEMSRFPQRKSHFPWSFSIFNDFV